MTTTLELEQKNEFAILRLSNGATNAISPLLVEECLSLIGQVRENVRAVILCGNSKFFSIGLSLPDLLPLERKAMEDFWHSFNTLVFTLYTLPIPVISAIEGHAVAGGTILALATDLRLAAAGKAKMGLNEISLGIPVPLLADMLLKQVVGQRQAMRMMYSGGLMGVDAAHAIGLVDEVHQQDKLFDAAVEKAAQMAEHSGPAFQRIKMGYIEEVVERFRQKQEAYDAAFLDIWFSQPIQEKLNEAAKNF